MSFTDQKPFVATKDDTPQKWGGCFHCGICGKEFIPGSVVRWVYGARVSTNFFTCVNCDDDPLKHRVKMLAEHSRLKRILHYK